MSMFPPMDGGSPEDYRQAYADQLEKSKQRLREKVDEKVAFIEGLDKDQLKTFIKFLVDVTRVPDSKAIVSWWAGYAESIGRKYDLHPVDVDAEELDETISALFDDAEEISDINKSTGMYL